MNKNNHPRFSEDTEIILKYLEDSIATKIEYKKEDPSLQCRDPLK